MQRGRSHNNVPRAGNTQDRATGGQREGGRGSGARAARWRRGGVSVVVATNGGLLHGRVEGEHFSVGGRTEPRGSRAALDRSHIKCRRTKRRRARLEARKAMAGKSTARAAIASRHGARRGKDSDRAKKVDVCGRRCAVGVCGFRSLLAAACCWPAAGFSAAAWAQDWGWGGRAHVLGTLLHPRSPPNMGQPSARGRAAGLAVRCVNQPVRDAPGRITATEHPGQNSGRAEGPGSEMVWRCVLQSTRGSRARGSKGQQAGWTRPATANQRGAPPTAGPQQNRTQPKKIPCRSLLG